MSNWLERAALTERARRKCISDSAERIVREVIEAVQETCESFNKHYQGRDGRSRVSCEVVENPNAILVRRTIKSKSPKGLAETPVTIDIGLGHGSIRVRCNSEDVSKGETRFQVDADEAGAFLRESDGEKKRITADEFSHRVLYTLLSSSCDLGNPLDVDG